MTTSPFPLRCSCGATITSEEWDALPLVGYQPNDGGVLVLKNCDRCHSTRAIETVEPTQEPTLACCADCEHVETLVVVGGRARCTFCASLASGTFESAVAA